VADTVLAALQRLPVSLRVPTVLRYYADLSERDIAVAIGRRQGTVKSRLHEARRRLAADPSMVTLAGDGAVDDSVEA
jgi:RNA polymerase sigma-70 factor (ECF subfamily)